MLTAPSPRFRPRGWLSTACGAWLLCAQAHALDGAPGTPAPAWYDTPAAARNLADLHTQIAMQTRAWVRVDVQIETVATPGATGPSAAWLSDLADRADLLLASLPAGSYRALDRPATLPSLTLEIDDAALAVLEESPWVAAVEPLPPSPLMTSPGNAPTVQRAPEPIADEYVVVFKEQAFSWAARRVGDLGAEVSSLGASLAIQYQGQLAAQWPHALPGVGLRLSAAAADALAKDPRVALVEQNGRVTIGATQAQPPWGLDRIDQRTLPLDQRFTPVNTAPGVNVYVIDTGIRTSHVDFAGRATWGTNQVDDQDADCHGHGTHVAGIVGGDTYGVAKEVNLIAVKVLDCAGSGSYFSVLGGIDWVAAHHQAPAVANMSLGGDYSAALNQAVANAVAAGVPMVVAAGNEAVDACTRSPSAAPTAITVGATTEADARAYFSNYGPCVDLFAPGAAILSAGAESDTAAVTLSGTSMAAPHVAGAIALYLQDNPGATPTDIATFVTTNATAGALTEIVLGSPNRLLFTAEADRTQLAVQTAGLGAVTSTPAGIDCGATCAASFDRDAAVELIPTPGPDWSFAGWGADCAGTSATCTLVMDAVKTVAATFVDANGDSERFPAGGTWPAGWLTPDESAAAWEVVATPVSEGQTSLQSGAITAGQMTLLRLEDYFAAGEVTFDWTVSSETGWDWLAFYIDGQLKNAISGCAVWSPLCWQPQRFPLTAGHHVLEWAYQKDGNTDLGRDAGWLDNVALPARVAPPPNAPPQAAAGGPYTVSAGEAVTLDGRVSRDPDGTLVTYAWDFGDGASGTGVTPTHVYAHAGSYSVTLTVTDDRGASDRSTSLVTVTPPQQVLFFDGFEQGQWNNLWVSDGQNAWFASTQRAADGWRSAEVDGVAKDATLTSRSIPLQGAREATITFEWYIEAGLDAGEYLAFDLSLDDGRSWWEQARLRGNVDPENQTLVANIPLTGLASNDVLRLRFRGTMSAGDEDANVDIVRVVAPLPDPDAGVPPTAAAGGPYTGIEQEPITFSAAASSDPDGMIVSYEWSFGDGTTGSGVAPTHTYLTAGDYSVGLLVEDDAGNRTRAWTTVTVTVPPGTPVELWTDSFENGRWNGLWEQDSQNDWLITTQRATAGRAAAEVDGLATDATLTSVPIDLQGSRRAVIAFAWLIEGSFDAGEYLAFDASLDGGATWREYARLSPEQSPRDQWQTPVIELTDLASNDQLRLRFRARASAADEDANIDAVRVLIVPRQPADGAPPVADPGGPYRGEAGRPLEFDARVSSDPDGQVVGYHWDFGDGETALGPQPTHVYAAHGHYTAILTVTDDQGNKTRRTVAVTVTIPPGVVTTLFSDQFEQGQWAGLWEEDPQDAWATTYERRTSGAWSAMVDGPAVDATLTSPPIELLGATQVRVTLDWYLEAAWDAGEYLAVDVSRDDGRTWTPAATLQGDSADEGRWVRAAIDVAALPAEAVLRLRLRATVSAWNEDANVDTLAVTTY